METIYKYQEELEAMVDAVLDYIKANQQEMLKKEYHSFLFDIDTERSSFSYLNCTKPTGAINIYYNSNEIVASSKKVVDFSSFRDCIYEKNCEENVAYVGVTIPYLMKICEFVFCFHEILKKKFRSSKCSKLFKLQLTSFGFDLQRKEN